MSINIILISGKQGSGKTTLGKALCSKINEIPKHRAVHMSFAEPLYKMHNFIWGYLEAYGYKRPGVKDGWLLQTLGTEFGRQRVSENVWVDILQTSAHQEADKYKEMKTVCVVSDCRFRNEFDKLKTESLTIRLACAKEVRLSRCEAWRDHDQHLSEIDLDDYSNAGLFDLNFNTEFCQVDNMVNTIIKHEKLKDFFEVPVK